MFVIQRSTGLAEKMVLFVGFANKKWIVLPPAAFSKAVLYGAGTWNRSPRILRGRSVLLWEIMRGFQFKYC